MRQSPQRLWTKPLVRIYHINLLFQELWYRADYELLKSTMPYVTEYDSKYILKQRSYSITRVYLHVYLSVLACHEKINYVSFFHIILSFVMFVYLYNYRSIYPSIYLSIHLSILHSTNPFFNMTVSKLFRSAATL